MSKSFLFLFLCLPVYIWGRVDIWLVDPLEAIYPDENKTILANYKDTWSTDVPSNGFVEVHLVLNIPIGESYNFAAFLEGKELSLAYWATLIEVPVEQNTGLDSRTEAFKEKKNPHVIRRAPFYIYEIIQPIQKDRLIAQNKYSALRLAIPTAVFSRLGTYKIDIEVKGKDWLAKGVFTPTIHAAEIPPLSFSQFFYTNWFSLKNMEEKHALERWTDDWFLMLDQYAKLMAHGRQNCITIPQELIALKDKRIQLDEETLLRFIQVFRKNGFRYFESPHLANRGADDDWGSPEFKIAIRQNGYYSAEGKSDVDTIMRLIQQFNAKNNLTNQWLQHIADEPTPVNAKCYRAIVAQVKAIYPEVKIMEATNARDSLVGAIDLWCPLINDFQENEAFFRAREKRGEQVLVYTCLIPGGQWLNRTLDMEKIRQVYFGWGAAYYNTFGYLHWGLNQYMADPFRQSVVKHPSPAASANNFLPAGDTHVIYPGKEGPLSSIRFEAHRIGIEDYELLQQLKKKNSKLFNKLMESLFRSYTDYSTDLNEYRKTRKKLFKELSIKN